MVAILSFLATNYIGLMYTDLSRQRVFQSRCATARPYSIACSNSSAATRSSLQPREREGRLNCGCYCLCIKLALNLSRLGYKSVPPAVLSRSFEGNTDDCEHLRRSSHRTRTQICTQHFANLLMLLAMLWEHPNW